jgi:hypothetical protein
MRVRAILAAVAVAAAAAGCHVGGGEGGGSGEQHFEGEAAAFEIRARDPNAFSVRTTAEAFVAERAGRTVLVRWKEGAAGAATRLKVDDTAAEHALEAVLPGGATFTWRGDVVTLAGHTYTLGRPGTYVLSAAGTLTGSP